MDDEMRERLAAFATSNEQWHETATELLGNLAETDAEVWAAVAELRDELHALSNRVESLTRALGDGGRLHSVKV